MTVLERLSLPFFNRMDPETAHGLALKALNSPFAPCPGPVTAPRLATQLAGLALPNPVGLAAGFDKNAVAVPALMRAGFGFLEVGAATPRPQPGNPRPRLFRLREDRAAINRFGFNNDGMDAIVSRLKDRPKGIPVGINLGANKDSADRAADFATVMACMAPHIDFATVNVSSPNTERLRDLQGAAALSELLAGVMEVRAGMPVLLKIAPDLTDAEIGEIATVAIETKVQGIIATNTTLSRAGLTSRHAGEAGGLSGQPLFDSSTRVLARLYRETSGTIPLIGVGGVGSPRQAYEKLLAGATAVQLYTAMVYGGLSLAAKIARGLDIFLARDGYASVADAVGQNVEAWV